MTARLEARALELSLPGAGVLVSGVSLGLAPGECVALVGPSGAGKSLTALALMGLSAPVQTSAGGVFYDGRRLEQASDFAALRGRRLGLVLQDPAAAMSPMRTLGDQLVEAVRQHTGRGNAAARERAVELLGEVGLAGASERLASYPFELSGGQRQRVAVALALAGDPELLLADEPTTALDVGLQAQLLHLFGERVRQRRLGLLLITHNLALLPGLAGEVLVMAGGALVARQPLSDLLAAPAHPAARSLVEAARARSLGSGLPA